MKERKETVQKLEPEKVETETKKKGKKILDPTRIPLVIRSLAQSSNSLIFFCRVGVGILSDADYN